MKKIIIAVLLLVSLISATVSPSFSFAATKTYKPFDEIWFEDTSSADFSSLGKDIETLTFSSDQKWPAKLPTGFDPKKLLEWGKDPGLGVRKLQSLGYTGKGVNVAYIDQDLVKDHVEYVGQNVRYYNTHPELHVSSPTMHGPSVLSLLAGKDIGVAPDSTVYYFANASSLLDQKYHAESLRKLIEVNKGLPDDQKIRIVGFSDSVDPNEKNPEDFAKAIKEAEAAGIMVITVNNIWQTAPLYIPPFKDKNDIKNYEVAEWAKKGGFNGALLIPSSGRTTANGEGMGSGDIKTRYTYWTNAGISWTVPYLIGVLAMGLQVDPTLTKEKLVQYINESSTPLFGGRALNPEGFIQLVQKNSSDQQAGVDPINADHYYVVYNSDKVNSSDMDAINTYSEKLGKRGKVILKDVKGYADAPSIYEMLKTDWKSRKGVLKGIQIIGTSEDVPAFNIQFKVQMQNAIDDAGMMRTDFFYSNFDNNSAELNKDFSIYKRFEEKLKTDFVADWTVSRLPLLKGEISSYMSKADDYFAKTKNQTMLPLVNFSNPIFASKVHSDDMAQFIRERLDGEFSILNDKQYSLYGNKDGYFPIQTTVLGNYSKENLAKENQKGIMNLFINSHGQRNNIDQAVFENSDRKSEKRISLMNSSNINTILGSNYYNLITWTCDNIFDLLSDTLVHKALSQGKAINAMAASSIISNNGVQNSVPFDELKDCNFYYFQYVFFDSLASGYTLSESFDRANREYAQEIMKHRTRLGEGNYQFSLHNVLSYHYLGLIEYEESKSTGIRLLGQKNTKKSFDGNIDLGKLSGNASDIQIKNFSVLKSKSEYKFKLEFNSKKSRQLAVFIPPDGILVQKYVVVGNNNYTFEISIADLEKARSLTINFYDDNSNEFISLSLSDIKNAPMESNITQTNKAVKSANVQLTSKSLKIDVSKLTITIGKSSVPLSTLKKALVLPNGASMVVLKADGRTNITAGNVPIGAKVKVTAENGATTKVYTIKK